jgi:hypothetical protein
MKWAWNLGLVFGLILAPGALGQAPGWRFQWEPNQVLTYKVEQTTTASEVIEGKKAETVSRLANTKRWQVLDVDAAGTATLQLSMAALKIETTTPTGEVMVFDSANPDKSNPQMREQLSKFVGQPLATLRVNKQGKVVEVKECKFGPASRFECEPPFIVTFPPEGFPSDWDRSYQVTVEPPQGAGEKYDAVQKYSCRTVEGKIAGIAFSTALKTKPMAPVDEIPLFSVLPQGQVQFDFQAGKMLSARLTIQKELTDHQGAGSNYHFQSSYSEELIPDR